MQDRTTRLLVLALCCLYFMLGTILIPQAGIQNDEALFANPIYQNLYEFRIRAFHQNIPIMLISYIGTLKSGVYWLLFHLSAPSVWTVRLPMLFLGSITIFLFYCLVKRISTSFTAAIAAILLATDQTFLLTNTFDWGPVAIEHVLLVTACLLFVKFSESGRCLHLGAAFAMLGLGVWNKAIFLWALTGLTAAAAVILWPEIRKRLEPKYVKVAVAGFLLGALPYVIYNVERPNATLRENVKLEIPSWNNKFIQVPSSLAGGSMLGYVTNEDWADNPKPPNSALARMAFSIRSIFGERRGGLLGYVIAGCILLVPLWWRSRAARFSLVFCAVAWLLMAITVSGGTSPHHVVLLWPFPQLFAALTLAAIPWRAAAMAVAIAVGGSNLLVWNLYLHQFERNGAGPVFTDALYPLSARVGSYGAPKIFITDWGIANGLALLQEGRLPQETIDDLFPANSTINPGREEIRARTFGNREAIYVGHIASQEALHGIGERVTLAAAAAGLRKQVIETVPDSNGRPVFEIFRLVPY